jgi:hypothetical protein
MGIDKVVSFRLRAIEDDILSSDTVACLSDAFKPWRDASIGDVVGITRRLNARMGEGSLLSDVALLIKSKNGLLERSYDQMPKQKRIAYADAIIMSGLGTAWTFLLKRMESLSYYTMADPYEYELAFLHGAVIFSVLDPVSYHEHYVTPHDGSPRYTESFAPIGTIIVPPSKSAHERLAKMPAVEDALAFYERHAHLRDRGVSLIALPPNQIEEKPRE